MSDPIDQRIFWDEDNEYLNLTLNQMKKSYVAITVHSVATDKTQVLPSGATILFWVAGDGYRTLVYRTSGNAQVLKNSKFEFCKVIGAKKSMISDGRILYLPEEEGTAWEDLGPITPGAATENDPDFEEIRRAHLKADPIVEDKINEDADDGWAGSGSFFSDSSW